jgi:hypothetical protein
MSFARAVRAVAATSVLAMAVGVVTTTSAQAAGKPAPGPTGLAATVTAHPGGGYDVATSWNAVASATGYRVALTKGGATLSTATVKTTTWSPTVTSTPGNASLSVRAVLGKKPGRASTLTVPLPDDTAPTGAFTSVWDDPTKTATITQSALDDDSGAAGVTRTVTWGDGASSPWASGTTIDHVYPALGRYTPTVTLEDAAHNQAVVDVPAIVIGDKVAPTGSFALGGTSAWATLTTVAVTQATLADDNSPLANITRTVDWGDGTVADWTGSAPLTHVYAVAGSFAPVVTMTDEAHNSAQATLDTVTVTVDSVGPVVRFVLPKSKHSVRAFTTLKGKATDTGGTGVSKVTVKAVEKRGTAWYGYNAKTKRWVKASSKTRAYGRARAAVVSTGARHLWTVKLSGLRKGTLVYKAFARDRVKNKSATISHQATLTRR